MVDKREVWIIDFLVPFIVDKEKLQLKRCKSVNDVQLKSANISHCNNVGVIFTVCYTVNIVLDVDGEEETIAIFVKVKLRFNTD